MPTQSDDLGRESKIAEIERLRKRQEIERLRTAAASIPTEPKQADHPSSQLSSGLQGAAQGASFGFSDELLAGAKAAYDKMKEGGGTFASNTPYGEFYNKRVQAEREAVQRAQEDNPLTYTGGLVGGSALTNFIPGVGIARGAGLGSTLAKAALQGGLVGAGESVPKDQGELLENIGQGAALGAATQGVFGGLAGMAGRLTPTALNKFAEERAVKGALGPNTGVFRKALGIPTKGAPTEFVQKQISKSGRDILDEGVLSTLSKTEDIGPKLTEAARKYGQEIGDIGKNIDEKVPGAFDPAKISQEILDYASTIQPFGKSAPVQEKVLGEAEKFAQMARAQKEYGLPALGFKNVQDIKGQYPFDPQHADALISNADATNKINSILANHMENAASKAEAVGGDDLKGLLERYQKAKSKYSTFKPASEAAGNEKGKDLMRRLTSPSDIATGIGTAATLGVTTGNLPLAAAGLLAGAANKFARERGSTTAAVIADNLAKKLESSPQFAKTFGQLLMDAVQRGPAALAATHLMLMKNPAYAQEFQQQPNGGIQ